MAESVAAEVEVAAEVASPGPDDTADAAAAAVSATT